MEKAPIVKIIDFSVVDGPGNRTALFTAGCNFSCGYCHNPETIGPCIHCGLCVPHCPVSALSMEGGEVRWNSDICVSCEACEKACPHLSSPRFRWMTAQEAMGKIEKNLPFIRGITLSGGECTLYPDFLLELFPMVHARGKTCFLDTNGTLDAGERRKELLALCDGVMLDVKAWDATLHQRLTGQGNDGVKAFALAAAQAGKLYEIRTVCLPDEVDPEACIRGMAELLGTLISGVRYKLIPYRPFGVREPYRSRLQVPDDATIKGYAQLAEEMGFSVEVV